MEGRHFQIGNLQNSSLRPVYGKFLNSCKMMSLSRARLNIVQESSFHVDQLDIVESIVKDMKLNDHSILLQALSFCY